MGADSIARGSGPEPTKYDKMRHESMRLRPLGLYGIPKIQLDSAKVFPGTCEACVFGKGEHIENCERHPGHTEST